MTLLNAGRFVGGGVGNVPKCPAVFCGKRVPKLPTGFAAPQPSISPAPRKSLLPALHLQLLLDARDGHANVWALSIVMQGENAFFLS